MPNPRQDFQEILRTARPLNGDVTADKLALDGLLFALPHLPSVEGSEQEQFVAQVMRVSARLSPTAQGQIGRALKQKYRLNKPAIDRQLRAAQQDLRRAAIAELTTDPESGLPFLILPGPKEPISACADKLGRLLATGQETYLRGGRVVTVTVQNHVPLLSVVDEARLCSLVEKYCVPVILNAEGVPEKTVLWIECAKTLLRADTLLNQLPSINVIAPCPVLVEREDGTLATITGYDIKTGIWAMGAVEDVPLWQAILLLLDLFADTSFATDADRSRAMAALLTLALVFGGLLGGRAPVLFIEADDSQAGKGYILRFIAAIFGFTLITVAQRKGGVGSMEELFNRALIEGHQFISLDNVRGTLDSPALESFMTEDRYVARALRTDMIIDPSRVVVGMTSNGANLTKDMANRCVAIKILRQQNKQWRRFGGRLDLLEFVKQHQPLYLGAVFAVIREWHRRGKPETDVTSHDRREWSGKLDWIVQNIFNLPPLLAGHEETRQRMSNPHLTWLREVCLAVRAQGHLGAWLRTNKLVDILEATGVELPGAVEGQNPDSDQARSSVFQATGAKLGRCFSGGDVIPLEQFMVERRTFKGEHRDSWEYRITEAGIPPDRPPVGSLIPPVPPDVSGISPVETKNKIGEKDLISPSQATIEAPSGGQGGAVGPATGTPGINPTVPSPPDPIPTPPSDRPLNWEDVQ